jgi:hypothetical protein
MNYTTFYEITTGIVTGQITSDIQTFPYDDAILDYIVLTGPIDTQASRVVGGAITTIPSRPSLDHTWDNAANGGSGGWVNNTPRSEQIADINERRFLILTATDWTQLADAPDYIKDSYAPYRVALREIELQADYPDTIIWPTPPEFELYRVPDAGGINEGSSVTVVLSTTQIVDNTLVPFTIHGANITVGDISTLRMNGDVIPTALTGNLEVIGGQATLQVTFANDLSTEGVEEMIVYLPGTLPMIKVRVNINDTSYA